MSTCGYIIILPPAEFRTKSPDVVLIVAFPGTIPISILSTTKPVSNVPIPEKCAFLQFRVEIPTS